MRPAGIQFLVTAGVRLLLRLRNGLHAYSDHVPQPAPPSARLLERFDPPLCPDAPWRHPVTKDRMAE